MGRVNSRSEAVGAPRKNPAPALAVGGATSLVRAANSGLSDLRWWRREEQNATHDIARRLLAVCAVASVSRVGTGGWSPRDRNASDLERSRSPLHGALYYLVKTSSLKGDEVGVWIRMNPTFPAKWHALHAAVSLE
jgi:hypothetical protein